MCRHEFNHWVYKFSSPEQTLYKFACLDIMQIRLTRHGLIGWMSQWNAWFFSANLLANLLVHLVTWLHGCSLNANFVFCKIENDKIMLPCTTTLQITTPMKISNKLVYYVLSYGAHKIKATHEKQWRCVRKHVTHNALSEMGKYVTGVQKCVSCKRY